MIAIQKCKKAPKKLDAFRKNLEASSNTSGNLFEKFRDQCREGYKELLAVLLKEQRGLCCYCMKKISNDIEKGKTFHVEHFKPKSKYKELSLEYFNLLASCNSNNSKIKTCGHAKGNKELEYIPNPACCEKDKKDFFERGLKYKTNGEIAVEDSYFTNEKDKLKAMKDLNDVLNLNNELIVNARKDKLRHFLNKWSDSFKRKGCKMSPPDFIDHYTKKNNFFDYYGFVRFHFLRKCSSNG